MSACGFMRFPTFAISTTESGGGEEGGSQLDCHGPGFPERKTAGTVERIQEAEVRPAAQHGEHSHDPKTVTTKKLC